jgi:hypothetical protein
MIIIIIISFASVVTLYMGLQRLTFVKFIRKKRMHPNKYDNPIHMLVCSSGYENMDYTT